MMEINNIFDEFCNKYRIRISPRDRFKAKITTPFGGLDSDPISFVAKLEDSKTLVLNDELLTYRFFDKNFYDPTSNALDIAMNILKTYGVDENEFKYIKKIDLSSNYWQEDVLDYITALIKLQDLIFLKKEIVIKEFLEIIKEYIKNNFDVKYKFYSQGIEAYDSESLYPVDIALSNDNKKFVNIYAINNHNKLTESTMSMMYYRYEAPQAEFYNISIFDELSKFAKGNKYKRLMALSDKALPDFGDFDKKILKEEINKRLGARL
ncbi:MAG TPA: hypothetical protein CFH82_06960 [Sulfurospirillum sp. UBA12182]|nr:MAG TPA: hypothetical protein CFH82_06960 [Sulfurospirillum sp. UBA12182]